MINSINDITLNTIKPSEKAVVELIDIEKSFGSQIVLNKISLKLLDGENLVILGKSGSGKSVLIKCIVQLITANAGVIKVFDEDVTQFNATDLGIFRQKIGFLFQSGALYDSMTVQQNIEFPLRRIKRNLNDKEITEKVLSVLENVGLKDALLKMPSELSGGMKKRISLARTLVSDPSIMLYDEPTTGLDPITSFEISELINLVQTKYKTSSIIITHDIKCAKHTANRVLMLEGGKVYKTGSLQSFQSSDDVLIKAFFSE